MMVLAEPPLSYQLGNALSANFVSHSQEVEAMLGAGPVGQSFGQTVRIASPRLAPRLPHPYTALSTT
ncbi:MAG: hypothetical protein IPL78_20450 [Chloroflexi bacterium]|nr:hypothetical protein [Chloroflexota bacterium]